MPKKTPKPAVAASNNAPFFVLGCVRSGTTMLRDVLRRHPNLGCPEETHFFRWAEPFGTDAINRVFTDNAVLKRHRELDGITHDEFKQMLGLATSRADLYQRYMALYLSRKKPTAKRWFDKTPQNVYGAMLAAVTMPRARFVHIVRNPLNVAASLRIGRIVKVSNLVGAASYWNEAVQIIRGLKRAFPARVYEFRYEDFALDPHAELKKLLDFIDEPYDPAWFADMKIKESDHTETAVLEPAEQTRIKLLCRYGMEQYGYLDAAKPTPTA